MTYNLLKDYRKLTSVQVETVCLMHVTGTDLQARQNAQMMYEYVMNSITDEAKPSLASHELDLYEDRPKLFFHIVNQLFTATFLNAQATHDKLLELHP